MLSAVFGIVGVIVGAVVAGGKDYLLALRADRNDERAAVRLLCTDLYKVVAVTADVANGGTWGPERGPLPRGAFAQHAGVLARMLSPESWKMVEGSVLGVERIDGIRAQMMDESRGATSGELRDIRRIRDFIQRSLSALDVEASYIEDGRPAPSP